MSDIKLFRFDGGDAEELPARFALVERELHDLMEKHMECFLGVRFVAHEYSTGVHHGGRIDSLGLDENHCPVIIEYKRHANENVINQGLYYLDWLLDHKAEFKLLVLDRFGRNAADALEWSGTRVLCVAGDFTKFDEHAVAQIGRNIELIRYKYFTDNLLMLEWLNPVRTEATAALWDARPRRRGRHRSPAAVPGETALSLPDEAPLSSRPAPEDEETEARRKHRATFAELLAAMPEESRRLYDEITSFILALGDDVNAKELLRYLAFTRLKNFVCLAPYHKKGFTLWIKLNPDDVPLEKGFSRDVRETGHWGTGDLELIVQDAASFAKARPLLERAYQES